MTTATNPVETVIETLKGMTALQLSELKTQIEDVFGVTAAAPMMGGMMAAPAAAEEVEEKTDFKVELKDFGSNKIQVIKAVRAVTGLGLKEAKAMVDGVPSVIKEDAPKDEADKIKADLEAAGATVVLS